MNNSRRLIYCLIFLGLLLLTDIILKVRIWQRSFEAHVLSKRFTVTDYRTNGGRAVVIVDRETGKPLWGDWRFGTNDKSDAVGYYYNGRNVMNIYPQEDQMPKMDVTFYGDDGAVKAIWLDRGSNAGFTERIRYDIPTPQKEIWFGESWHVLVYRTNNGVIRGGIVLNGEWHHALFTNGAAVIDP